MEKENKLFATKRIELIRGIVVGWTARSIHLDEARRWSIYLDRKKIAVPDELNLLVQRARRIEVPVDINHISAIQDLLAQDWKPWELGLVLHPAGQHWSGHVSLRRSRLPWEDHHGFYEIASEAEEGIPPRVEKYLKKARHSKMLSELWGRPIEGWKPIDDKLKQARILWITKIVTGSISHNKLITHRQGKIIPYYPGEAARDVQVDYVRDDGNLEKILDDMVRESLGWYLIKFPEKGKKKK